MNAKVETVPVVVTSSEVIAGRGSKSTRWYVRDTGRWVLASDFANATKEDVGAGPGTVWEVRTTLLLEPGTWLKRVESMPRPTAVFDPLTYLRREVRGTARSTTERFYVVQQRGRLAPRPAPPTSDH